MIVKTSKKIAKQLSELQRINVLEKMMAMQSTFRSEFKKQTVTAISAAFGFLIALVWRDYIAAILKTEQLTLWSAISITALCVLGLMIISKWATTNISNKEQR